MKTMIYSTQIKQYIKDENNNIQAVETIEGKIYSVYDIVIFTASKLHFKLIDTLNFNILKN
jgi:hypothetical protein